MAQTQAITRAIATKVRDTVDAGLVHGLGDPLPGEMCVEAAVCFALGLPHGDDPGCVSPALRGLKIRLNDSAWSSPAKRANGLRRLAVAQLGSKGVLDDKFFTQRVVEMTIRRVVPIALRAAARVNPAHAKALESAAVRCEREGTPDASAAAASAYASTYASASAYSSAYAATAATAAADAAPSASAATAADASAGRDAVLGRFAEWVVEILIDMKAPGCQWLDLVPVEAA